MTMGEARTNRNISTQELEPKLRKRKGRAGVWEVRYRRYLADGSEERPKEILGDEIEFPSKSAVRNSAKWKALDERVNKVRVVTFFRDLCRMYKEEQIPQWGSQGSQRTGKSNLPYLEDKWGGTRLDQMMQMRFEIRTWLEGDLPLRTNAEQQASRQTRKHLRTLLVQMFGYAADKNYVPYNPFTGTALTVKRGGALPVDRSRFYITPEQFRWMQSDPDTPAHVKTMQLIAYTAGMREEEFLALMWDDIDFDGPEPQIEINRTVDGKHIREFAKSGHSKAPVPMCDLLGAALLCYHDEKPSVNNWLFGSIRTGRPMWPDSLRQDHLRPALWRMAAKFKLRGVPEGTGFHSFRHAYNALIEEVNDGSVESIKQVQLALMRHGDQRTNDRYGKSAPPRRKRARIAQAAVTELAMGAVN
jgi:integrase